MRYTWEPFDWYATPRYYDIVFDDETAVEADFLEAMIDRYATGAARRSRRLLEPACGSGRLFAELARRGWSMSGFDASEEMLAFARRRLERRRLRGDLRPGRFDEFTARGRFAGAFCLVSSFQYVASEAEAEAHLERMADVLLPGGIYAIAVHLCDYRRQHTINERWSAARGATSVNATIRHGVADRRARSMPMRSRLAVTTQGRTRRFETTWSFRTWNQREFARLLASEPRFEHVATYDYWLEIERKVPFDRSLHDCVALLRRRADS
ncbi:MAG: class I SAM-dependent methyltransferase [Phycisphaerae bacterium]|nr:class I SAM-dependent methyltransferase [Phycisphaerae bacterium]